MKIALVHDDLMQWGGAEKVFAEISNIFPDAPIYTALVDFNNPLIEKNFKNKEILPSFLQKIPLYKKLYKPLLPLYPIAFEQFDFSKFDLVISHTTRFAKCIITKPETTHICYIHTPPRFLWNFSGEKTPVFLKPIRPLLREFDLISAKRVDYWICGSENCAKKVKEIYKTDSKVLYPFVDTKKFSPDKSFDGSYYLIISRLNKYKKVDIAVRAFNENGKRLIVVGTGPEEKNLKAVALGNIELIGRAGDELLESLISGCKALIITAEEDFGMTSIEAQSSGKSVICFGQGGVLETVKNGKTGIYFDRQSVESLKKAVNEFEESIFIKKNIAENADRFSKDKFREKLKGLVNEIEVRIG